MYKVLIVDDEPSVRQGLCMVFDWQKYGFSVVAAVESGEAALDYLNTSIPDVIISDICMSSMNGLELIKEVKKINTNIEFVFLSGYSNFNYAKAAIENGAFDYLLKPLQKDSFYAALQKLHDKLNQKRQDENILREAKQILNTKHISDDLSDDSNDYVVPDTKQNKLIYITDGINVHNKALTNQYIKDYFDRLTDEDINKELYFMPHKILADLSLDEHAIKECKEKFLDHDNYHSFSSKEQAIVFFDNFSNFLIETDVKFKMIYNQPIVNDVISYIQLNYYKQCSIEQISKDLLISSKYLMRLFKEHTKRTLNEYLTTMRLDCAKYLLSTNRYRVYDVTFLVGYNDTKYFSKIFKKSTGYTPSEYSEKES